MTFRVDCGRSGQAQRTPLFAPDPNGGVAANEIQVVTLPPGVQGGQFRLSFQNPAGQTDTTLPIGFDATAGGVQQALEALSSIGAGNVVVRGGAGGPWSVEFAARWGTRTSDRFPAMELV